MLERIGERIALGRAIREEALALVRRRRGLAESAAWSAARAPDLSEDERAFREAVAVRVSRLFAFVGIDRRH